MKSVICSPFQSFSSKNIGIQLCDFPRLSLRHLISLKGHAYRWKQQGFPKHDQLLVACSGALLDNIPLFVDFPSLSHSLFCPTSVETYVSESDSGKCKVRWYIFLLDLMFFSLVSLFWFIGVQSSSFLGRINRRNNDLFWSYVSKKSLHTRFII